MRGWGAYLLMLGVSFAGASCTQTTERSDLSEMRPAPALPEGPLTVKEGMRILADAELQELLEGVADGKLDGVKDQVLLDAANRAGRVVRRLDWAPFGKKVGALTEVEALTTEVGKRLDELARAAGAGERSSYPKLADNAVRRCIECHVNWRDEP